MRIVIDVDRCDSHGQCADAAPEVFHLGDDDLLQVVQERPAAEQHDAVRAAAARCPKLAITLSDT